MASYFQIEMSGLVMIFLQVERSGEAAAERYLADQPEDGQFVEARCVAQGAGSDRRRSRPGRFGTAPPAPPQTLQERQKLAGQSETLAAAPCALSICKPFNHT